MAEFDYYGTTLNDNLELIGHILVNTDLYLIPDIYYKDKSGVIFTRTVDEVIKTYIGTIGMFHLWNERFYPVFPKDFFTIDTEGYEGLLSLHASPSLTFATSRFIINKDDSEFKRISCGCLYHTRELYDKETHGIIPIPQSLKDEHKKVVKLMKERLIKVKNKNLWMGKEAYELFEKGELEVIYKGEWVNNKQ